ncbi:hypothetical protein HDU83_002399 [Entophlyctis luteolus]|nr:hypothetical protein HDU83_002399 [Entophlyctis luteolus]
MAAMNDSNHQREQQDYTPNNPLLLSLPLRQDLHSNRSRYNGNWKMSSIPSSGSASFFFQQEGYNSAEVRGTVDHQTETPCLDIFSDLFEAHHLRGMARIQPNLSFELMPIPHQNNAALREIGATNETRNPKMPQPKLTSRGVVIGAASASQSSATTPSSPPAITGTPPMSLLAQPEGSSMSPPNVVPSQHIPQQQQQQPQQQLLQSSHRTQTHKRSDQRRREALRSSFARLLAVIPVSIQQAHTAAAGSDVDDDDDGDDGEGDDDRVGPTGVGTGGTGVGQAEVGANGPRLPNRVETMRMAIAYVRGLQERNAALDSRIEELRREYTQLCNANNHSAADNGDDARARQGAAKD